MGASEPGRRRIDRVAAEAAAAALLAALGANVAHEQLRETPRRMIDAYAELLTPAPFRATTFPNDDGYDELVIIRGIPFHSLCMHHVQEHLEPKGVGVVLEAEHLCMSLRGVQKFGTTTVTSALHGLIRDDPRTRQEFVALTKRSDR
ncbi:MAG: GTP cyclohydrolase I [Actinomycetota bacterium]|nr:GTP cyclohydrolase I [Actinomycetota bacterium]